MTICTPNNSRIEIWFIGNERILNQVLILTFYPLLPGNNAAAVSERSVLSGTTDSLHFKPKCRLQQVICMPLFLRNLGAVFHC